MSSWNQISHRQAAYLFRRLATGYRAGIDLRTLWQREATSGRLAWSHRAKQVSRGIGEGDTLSESMERTDGFFSPLTVAVIRAGEVSGRLEQSFAKLAKYHEDWHRFYVNIFYRLSWPLFQLGAAILVIGALILLMDWALSSSNAKPVNWFGLGWSATAVFRAYVACVFLAAAAVGTFYVGIRAGWFGDWPMRILLRVPLIGGILKNTALARLTWAMSSALGAGMDVPQSLQLAFKAGRYAPVNRHADTILAELSRGDSIFETLSRAGCFSEEFLQLVHNGELSGELPETLERMSADYQERVDTGMRQLATACFIACFVLVAILIIAAIIYLFNTLIMGVYQEFGV